MNKMHSRSLSLRRQLKFHGVILFGMLVYVATSLSFYNLWAVGVAEGKEKGVIALPSVTTPHLQAGYEERILRETEESSSEALL